MRPLRFRPFAGRVRDMSRMTLWSTLSRSRARAMRGVCPSSKSLLSSFPHPKRPMQVLFAEFQRAAGVRLGIEPVPHQPEKRVQAFLDMVPHQSRSGRQSGQFHVPKPFQAVPLAVRLSVNGRVAQLRPRLDIEQEQ